MRCPGLEKPSWNTQRLQECGQALPRREVKVPERGSPGQRGEGWFQGNEEAFFSSDFESSSDFWQAVSLVQITFS